MKGKFFLLIFVCLFSAFTIKSQTPVTVNEEKSSIIFNEKTADVSFVLKNDGKEFTDKIALEIIDEKNEIRSQASQPQSIKNGENRYKLSMPVADFVKSDIERLAWYRLRWRVGGASGIISVSELIEDVFKLRVIASDNLFSGMTYRSRISATNPFNEKPVRGVKISASLRLQLSDADKVLNLAAIGETDENGFAVLDFQIPVEAKLGSEGEIKITGEKNGIFRDATEELNALRDDYSFPILTDKPIYQPEQILNLRGILLKGAEAKTVVSGEDIELRIKDDDEIVLFQQTVKTSEFGIAAFSWKIPENVKLGDYALEIRRDDENIGYGKVKISRYDLPNFAVSAKPDKTFYLPNEKRAEIEVRADYLFGKPVTKGKVRVVREKSREWNWKEQKYDVDEGEAREGETDADGRFIAEFDLGEAHEDLKNNDWRKFEDINFAAYFTDPTTNKTEQKRFDVRVTKEAIHVYFIGDRYNLHPDLPVDAFVSTFYADGSPAVCDVEIKGSEEDEDKFKTLQKLKTNSYGAGKLGFKRPKYEDETADMDLKIIAEDKHGKTGTFKDDINFDNDDVLIIKTDKTVYKPGETVKIGINSNMKTGLIYIDVVKGWSVIDSSSVKLGDGKAELQIPFRENFQGELKIAAYYEEENEEIIKASRGIIFPNPQNLKLDASFEKASYKPGEEASLAVKVSDTVGKAVESVLGVVVLDQAVEERAKTDADFGGMFKSFSGWLGYGDSFGGVNVKDLNELDLTKPVSDEMQLVADLILHDNYYYPNMFRSRDYETDAKALYAGFFQAQFNPVESALKETYKNQNFRHPNDSAELSEILAENNLNLEILRDPWEQNYRAVFDVVQSEDVVKIVSAGADKKFDTRDDLIVSSMDFTYFTPTGRRIDEIVNKYHERTGKFIRDEKTLLSELGTTALLDRFGRPYRFDFSVSGRDFQMAVRSIGKDGAYEEYYRGDDFIVWTNKINYFADTETKIGEVFSRTKSIPADEKQFAEILSKNGIAVENIRDGYDQKTYLTTQRFSRFTDRVTIENVGRYGEEKTTERTTVTPVTQEVLQITLRSRGKDAAEGNYDDFTLAQFLFILSEQAKEDKKPQIKKTAFVDGTGAVGGTVTDSVGSVVSAATVTAINEESKQERVVATDENGRYLIADLADGNYSVKARSNGFKDTVRTGVPIKANATTKVDFVLEAGNVSEAVTVSADVTVETNTTNASIGSIQREVSSLPINGRRTQNFALLQPGAINRTEEEKSTPRLREYFPETLVWNPELVTDKNGRAEMKFKMADNITTWKLYTIASTKNGKIGVAEKEVQAFQPFFVDLDPPRFLTDGDEIFLPVQVRNYTGKKQKTNVSMAKSDWFSFLSSERQQIEVASDASENAVFGFKATSAIKNGKQKVTATASTASDAIEKGVTVKPNGQEIVKTESKIFSNNTNFAINFPGNALAKTPSAELKIYPNLFSHVSDSVEGLLQRPYGCGEQTISSTYPNLMILKFTKEDDNLRRTARKYLQKGYEKLLGYQVSSGGFSYWGGKEEADVALTAYAIRFLSDADGFVDVDQTIVEKAQSWLVAQQHADGSFTKKYYYETSEDARRAKIFTSYVARTLAMLKAKNAKFSQAAETALQKSLGYLKMRSAEIDEPYALALFGLASFDAGNFSEAKIASEKLSTLAIAENDSVYWKLETNTPFYGWGTPGRIETTALVLQLLIKTKNQSPKTEDLISKGTMFLLKNKDRYGVWYSTQTTVNVLDALLASLANGKNQPQQRLIQVLLNGAELRTFVVMPEMLAPITFDLKDKLNASANNLEIKSLENSPLTAQVVQSHYIDWRDAEISNRDTNDSRQIRLDYECDRQSAAIMQEISCSVEAERVGFKGYGMLLAEIGIPPGADVSRESLEKTLQDDWSLSRYDILPDRIVFYMWSKAGGTKFNFKFRPRYAVNANTPASVIYDYYNEESRGIVAPLKFTVK